jgi:hypothetical protein
MKHLTILAAMVFAALGLASFATADTISPNPITFNSDQGYTLANINGQQSWSNTGLYDANVVSTSFSGFGDQTLQISNAKTSGSFGDQTFAPALATAAGQGTATQRFDASFSIATTQSTQQTGLSISVSPDNGQGARMSYLRFDDQVNGVHVFFDDIRNTKTFKERDIATLSRSSAHTIKFSLDLKSSNDSAKIYIDGRLAASGTTWEGYYPLAGESVPTVSTMLFRASGTAAPLLAGEGYLIDNLTYTSS